MSEKRYSLSVTAWEPNPAYSDEAAREVERRNAYVNGQLNYLAPEISRPVLTVDLTEDGWVAVKRAVLEVKL